MKFRVTTFFNVYSSLSSTATGFGKDLGNRNTRVGPVCTLPTTNRAHNNIFMIKTDL